MMTRSQDSPRRGDGTSVSSADTVRLRARWVFPVDRPPLENGVLEIVDGRIAAVHNRHEPRAHDLGDMALIPGLVNAHTHLEFSDLDAPLTPAAPFSDWIRAIVAHRRSRTAPVESIVRHGIAHSVIDGTRALGEIATDEASLRTLAEHTELTGVVFRELLGLLPEAMDGQLDVALRHLESTQTGNFIAGLSPHAPYSVHPELFHRLIDLARDRRAPVAMHLAETEAERELLRRSTGELVDLLRGFGVWRDGVIPSGTRPMDYLVRLAELDRALVVHGNYLDEDELEFLAARPQLTVVYCPRTHAFFGHDPHPWQRLIERGGSVALGTDSRASNPNLSLWEELQFLRRRHPEVDPALLLELGTLRGARAMGLEAHAGTLAEGQPARFACVALTGGLEEPWSALFAAGNAIPPRV